MMSLSARHCIKQIKMTLVLLIKRENEMVFVGDYMPYMIVEERESYLHWLTSTILLELIINLKRIFFNSVMLCLDPAGLALFCCMPTTLSSGVALTQACLLFFSFKVVAIDDNLSIDGRLWPQLAGGNSALALAMTLISNLLGILIVSYNIFFVGVLSDNIYRFSEQESCARYYLIYFYSVAFSLLL